MDPHCANAFQMYGSRLCSSPPAGNCFLVQGLFFGHDDCNNTDFDLFGDDSSTAMLLILSSLFFADDDVEEVFCLFLLVLVLLISLGLLYMLISYAQLPPLSNLLARSNSKVKDH